MIAVRLRALRLRHEQVAWHLEHGVEDARVGDVASAKLVADHAGALAVPIARTLLLGEAWTARRPDDKGGKQHGPHRLILT